MSKKKQKAKRAKGWTFTVGDLTAYERKDRDGRIYTRVMDHTTGNYRDRSPLCDPIRNAAGEIDLGRETEARRLAIVREREISAGVEKSDEGLTLRSAAKLYLDPKQGKFAGESDWKYDVTRYLEIPAGILGNIPIAHLERASYKKVWRFLAHEHLKDTTRFGFTAIEKIVGALRAMIVWLIEEEYVHTAVLPSLKWKEAMRKDWLDITGKPIPKPKKLRETKAEQEKLFAALPKADPRIRLAVELGAELRLGQVVRTKRSDVMKHGEHEIGAVQVHGRGKKHGTLVILTDDQRSVLVEALTTGYLSDLEALYQAKQLDDYLLVSGEYLRHGKAQLQHAMALASPRAMRNWWMALEKRAGVEHVKGRGWYGLRRLGADLQEDVCDDDRVNNAQGGWTDTKTRTSYQQEGRIEIYEEAAKARVKIRPKRST